MYGGDGNDQMSSDGDGLAMLFDGGNGNDTIGFDYDSPIESIYGDSGNDVINDNSGYSGTYIDAPDRDSIRKILNPVISPISQRRLQISPSRRESRNSQSMSISTSPSTAMIWTTSLTSGEARTSRLYGNGLMGTIRITATAEPTTQLDTTTGQVSLDGGSGNDLLHGYASTASTLKGGDGNDTLIGDADYGHPLATPSYTYEGDSGTDTADFSDQTANLTLHIDGQPDSGAVGQKDLISGDVENIIGGSGNDLITGNPSNNSLEGGAGDDTIWGSSGNDTLVGDAGHDQLHGQDGNDVLYGKDGQTDTLDGGDGTDKASRDNSNSVKDQVLSIESFI